MRCTLCPVHELTRETEIDCGKCDSYTRCCRNLRPLIHWVWQKFCDLLYTGCRRNSATIHTLGVAEILRPLIHWMQQKFYDHTHTLDVEEIQRSFMIIHKVSQKILQRFIHWVLQKFCNHSDTESGRKSATIHTLDVAEIFQPLTDWMSKRFREKILH